MFFASHFCWCCQETWGTSTLCPFCGSETLLMCVFWTFQTNQIKTCAALRAQKADFLPMPCPRTLHRGGRLLGWFKGTAAEHHMSTYTLALHRQRQPFNTLLWTRNTVCVRRVECSLCWPKNVPQRHSDIDYWRRKGGEAELLMRSRGSKMHLSEGDIWSNAKLTGKSEDPPPPPRFPLTHPTPPD